MRESIVGRRLQRGLLGMAICMAIGSGTAAADSSAPPAEPQVSVDLVTGHLQSVLPFEIPFVITGSLPATMKVTEVRAYLKEKTLDDSCGLRAPAKLLEKAAATPPPAGETCDPVGCA